MYYYDFQVSDFSMLRGSSPQRSPQFPKKNQRIGASLSCWVNSGKEQIMFLFVQDQSARMKHLFLTWLDVSLPLGKLHVARGIRCVPQIPLVNEHEWTNVNQLRFIAFMSLHGMFHHFLHLSSPNFGARGWLFHCLIWHHHPSPISKPSDGASNIRGGYLATLGHGGLFMVALLTLYPLVMTKRLT